MMASSIRFDTSQPLSFLEGRIPNIPPSKSIVQRALICAALAEGTTTFLSKPVGDDCDLLINALQKFGVSIHSSENSAGVTGGREHLVSPVETIFMRNNGTGVRFLLALSLLVNGKATIDGDKRLRERPMKEMFNAFRELGVSFQCEGGRLPVTVSGGDFIGGEVHLDASRSSQFLSAMLLVAPFAKSGLTIHTTNSIVSSNYVDITIDVMKHFGVTVERVGSSYVVPPQTYTPHSIPIEPDASSASYFFAAAAITNSKVTVKNIPQHSLQPDFLFLNMLEQMNCAVERNTNSTTVTGKKLRGISIDCNTSPDIVPTLAVAAAFAEGETEIKNVAHLRHKESDRIAVLARELRKIGTEVIEKQDGLIIAPKPVHPAVINPEYDHRIAMSFAVAGLLIPGLEILQPECVQKSFPGFWTEFLP